MRSPRNGFKLVGSQAMERSSCFTKKASRESYIEASTRFHDGKLVAFPTETVYGLGANALSTTAVLKIFEAKKRPLTDPLIVHVPSVEDVSPLVSFTNESIKSLFDCLASQFWPGPLTIILKASKKIPKEITAETGFVGIRIPNSKTALAMLKECKLPIAAPSANRFGHVSPTTAAHVDSDLSHADLLILENDSEIKVGIESTVCKIEVNANNDLILKIYRKGGVSREKLENALKRFHDELSVEVIIEVIEKEVKNKAEPSPGQEITHYAPDIQSFMIDASFGVLQGKSINIQSEKGEVWNIDLNKTVFIDFFQNNINCKQYFLDYFDLNCSGDAKKAAKEVFKILRLAENVPNAEYCLVVNIKTGNQEAILNSDNIPALYDRLYRSCSGRKVQLC